MIADLCIKHNVLCISDEVYEWLTYDAAKHVKIGETQTARLLCKPALMGSVLLVVNGDNPIAASLPGMWERTITIGSGGKTFSATGWKVRRFDFPPPASFLLSASSYGYLSLFPRLAGPSALDTS